MSEKNFCCELFLVAFMLRPVSVFVFLFCLMWAGRGVVPIIKYIISRKSKKGDPAELRKIQVIDGLFY